MRKKIHIKLRIDRSEQWFLQSFKNYGMFDKYAKKFEYQLNEIEQRLAILDSYFVRLLNNLPSTKYKKYKRLNTYLDEIRISIRDPIQILRAQVREIKKMLDLDKNQR